MDNELLKLKISRRIRSAKGRREYLLVKIKNNFAVPILKDSGAIASLADADGYVIIPKNIEYIEKNDVVEVKLFSY
jgi:molybdopterin molybdotransferase